jgi:hypothetical protein
VIEKGINMVPLVCCGMSSSGVEKPYEMMQTLFRGIVGAVGEPEVSLNAHFVP